MPTDLERQLAGFAEGLDLDAPAVSFDEVVSRGTVSVDVDLLEGSASDRASNENGLVWSDSAPGHDAPREGGGLIELAPTLVIRRPAWRRVSLRVALGAAAVAVLVVGLATIERGGDELDAADDLPALTSTFVSPRHGYSINYPDGAVITPAVQSWGLSERVDDGFDVVELRSGAVLRATSAYEFPDPDADSCHEGPTGEEVPCGTIDDQVDRYLAFEPLQFDGCGVPRSTQAEITIDGKAGHVAQCPSHVEATVVTGGRLYLFTLSHGGDDARALFDAVAATIDLTPETGLSFAAMTTTFVSPTYGLSFNHFDREGDTPAAEPWDPANEPAVRHGRFDEVETGSGAIFAAASTEIPAGVSIDAWVDEYVTSAAAGGCGVPRSTQAEITIDGQPGRTVECASRAEATVVAGGRLYLLRMYFNTPNPKWFGAWLATIDLTPETATTLDGSVQPASLHDFGTQLDALLEQDSSWAPTDRYTADYDYAFNGPCSGSWGEGATGGSDGGAPGTSGDGMGTFRFPTTAQASDAAARLVDNLSSCTTTEWQTAPIAQDGAVLASSADAAAWIQRIGDTVTVLQVATTDGPPPAGVQVEVAEWIVAYRTWRERSFPPDS